MDKTQNNVVPFSSKFSKSVALPNLVISLRESEDRINELNEFVQKIMVKGVDYGIIGGFSKPTLLKPGAEKLCDVFGFSKVVEVTNRIEDWEKGVFAYEVKLTLIAKETGTIEAEGLGSCNSKEPSFKKQNPYTNVNTVLKMAKKRALIDAVLSATRASGLFTQDIEDFQRKGFIKGGDEHVTNEQLMKIIQLMKEELVSVDIAKGLMMTNYKVKHSKELTNKQAAAFIEELAHLVDAYRDLGAADE